MGKLTITGITHWSIPVNNLEDSEKFYGELLGFEARGRLGNSYMSCFGIEGHNILLCRRDVPVDDAFGVRLLETMVSQGHATVRFGFPHMEAGRRRPDRPEVLEETWRKVIGLSRSYGSRMVIGGRSMGGRIASHVVAQGEPVDALVLFAYPLRSPGGKVRDGHLGSISVPTLFLSGTKDTFGTPEELRDAAAKIPGAELHLLDGADHGFNMLKSSGKTRNDVWEDVVGKFSGWLDSLA